MLGIERDEKKVSRRRAKDPNANNWDKLAGRRSEETLRNRDVHGKQQLDRTTRKPLRTRRPGVVLAVVTGLLVTAAVWVLHSLLALIIITAGTALDGVGSSTQTESQHYYKETTTTGEGGKVITCYKPLTKEGTVDLKGDCYDSVEAVPVPDWYVEPEEQDAAAQESASAGTTFGEQMGTSSMMKLWFSLGAGSVVALVVATWYSRRVDRTNLMRDSSDINEHVEDQHIALPEEIQRELNPFPDAGAHSSVEANSMISHAMAQTKGLPKVAVTVRHTADVLDEDGEVVSYAGEPVLDEEGEVVTTMQPIIDKEFGDALFDASGLTEKHLRQRFDTRRIPYNPGDEDRGKLKGYATVADLIKGDWELPDYEVQRPAGVYLVDSKPVNTMVLAMTRAGKGQTYIEPTVDMWTREKKPSNMVLNDPKGELLMKFWVPLVTRGYQPVQFNLVNPPKTDIYNPLGIAAKAAREGDATKCALYVSNQADVFFPLDGSEDPVWPNAANNAFKRAAYGLIDFYLEEERELRAAALEAGTSPETLERKLDDMWGKVTPFNCYQLFVQLTSRKLKNPKALLEQREKAGEFEGRDLELEQEKAAAEAQDFLWEGKGEQDMLTLYFNATEALPRNTIRGLVGDANNALRAMAGAEKMMASVYGIAITAMSFFTDPTISTLTSGKPSQNIDLAGLSFPRRLGVRFAQDYLKRDHLIGQQALWTAYADSGFTEDLGEDFRHSDMVSREGWARYLFKGIFPESEAWVKLELVNPQTRMLVRTFYFHFKKGHQLRLNGRHFVVEPVTGNKVVRNGVLRELQRADDRGSSFAPGDTLYPHERLDLSVQPEEKVSGQARAIIATSVDYSEQPKAIFFITPPQMAKYAKLILILVKQLFDISVDQAYMSKDNQKPLYRTRYMLDELGNLQSEGHGIEGFETMLSIGLGQEQQFTLILQTLQQLRDVYGDNVDKIVEGNVPNTIFLKSTDDSMLEDLEKKSGTTHKSYINSKQISQDLDKMIGGRTEGRVSYTESTEKEPLISYNDLNYLPERNSVVFRAGQTPVWNRNATILPMSYRLFESSIQHPGHKYTLQTLPTLSSAMDFDVRMNQPDFVGMLNKRMQQATRAEDAQQRYQDGYGYKDVDIARLDPDVYSDEVMELVAKLTKAETQTDAEAGRPVMTDLDAYDPSMIFSEDQMIENVEVNREVAARQANYDQRAIKVYAEGMVSKDMLVNPDGSAKLKSLDVQISEAYRTTRLDLERDHDHFMVGAQGELRSADGTQVFITPTHSEAWAEAAEKLNASARDENSRVYAEEDLRAEQMFTVQVHAAFYQYLASLPSWEVLAEGRFDREMGVEMKAI